MIHLLDLKERQIGKLVGSGKKWESIDLKLDDLKEPKAEFVVVSMAGTELLRKSFQLHETVVTVKTTLSRTLKSSWNRPADFIRLCLGSQALSNAKELGRSYNWSWDSPSGCSDTHKLQALHGLTGEAMVSMLSLLKLSPIPMLGVWGEM